MNCWRASSSATSGGPSPAPTATARACSPRPAGGRSSSTRSASCRLLTQAKLLRVIEAKEVLPVGATRCEPIAARVVAATNKDLAAEVAAARFRADLYYRLNVVSIPLPPLRDRREDIPDLIAVLLARHARALNKRVDGLDNAAVRRLAAAPWKGNVRELGNALERAVILGESPDPDPRRLPRRPGLRRSHRRRVRRPPRRPRPLRTPAHPPGPRPLRRRQARGRPPPQPRPLLPLPQARRPGRAAKVESL